MKSPDPQTGVLLFSWQTHWTSFVALLVQATVLAWYITSTRRLAAIGRRWSMLRTASFAVGVLVLAYATEGGIAHYQVSNFTAHAVQVLLLVNVGPALLALGAPITLALQSSSRRTTAVLLDVLRSSTARALTRPLVALVVAMGSLFAYFLTPLYAVSERHPLVLAGVQLYLVLVGWLLWTLIVGRDGLPRRLGFGVRFVLVFLLVPINLVLGLVIAGATQALYPPANTLADTQQGGNVLLGLTEVMIVLVVVLLFVEWAREEERAAVRGDRQLDAALAAGRAAVGPDEHLQPDTEAPQFD